MNVVLWRLLALFPALAFLPGVAPLHAALELPRVFSDHMVLQRDKPVPIWGSADPGASISVAFNGATQTATADSTGRWKLTLPAMKASATGQAMTIHANDASVTLSDILIGDVWLCAGQSNMEFTLAAANGGHDAVASAGQLTHLRLLHVTSPASGIPADDISNAWTPCTSATAASFSAVAFFFGQAVSEKVGVPVGLIEAAWGGTPIQPWTPKEGFALDDKLKTPDIQAIDQGEKTLRDSLPAKLPEIEAWIDKTKTALANNTELPALPEWPVDSVVNGNPGKATVIFNSRIHPLIPYAIRGVIWYQGESNHGDALYANRLRALITSWRQLWGQGDFPFYFVQPAPLGVIYAKGELVDLWQAQTSCLTLPNTGMAVTNDIGDLTTIHPKDKKDVGDRLARIAFAKEYALPGIVDSGPVYHAMQLDGAKLRITFDHADGGLVARDGQPLTWFEIAGADGNFVAADAAIEGQQVAVSSAQVPVPKSVRFAWANNAVPNLTNHDGLPTPAFQASLP